MLHAVARVHLTFSGASTTNVSAQAAELFCPVTAETHELRGGVANGSTFHIKLDTARHHLYVFFFKAGRSAMVANGCAAKAGINARLILVVARSICV